MMGMNKPDMQEQTVTYRELLRIFIPLSLSDMIMVLAGPLVGTVLGRLPDAKVQLAAQGVALNLAILLESPIIMMLNAGTAAAANPAAYRALGRLMWLWNGFITLLFAALAFTPAFDWVASGLLGLPPEIAAASRPAFGVMILWPAAIGVRRYMQGQLIYHRRSPDIMKAGLVRLAALVSSLLLGAAAGLPGAVAAGVAAVVSVLAEAGAIFIFSQRLRRELAAQPAPAPGRAPNQADGVPTGLTQLFWWYLPLAGTQVVFWIVRPLLTGGIARAEEAALSLAAWPVAWSTVNMIAIGTRMIQQLTLSVVKDAESFRRVRNFGLMVGLTFTAIMGLIGFTPLSGLYLRGIVGLSPDLAAISVPVLALGAFLPLQVALQNWMQALLVKSGRTGLINLGALIAGSVTLSLTYAGALLTALPGAALAAGASIVGHGVELGFLWLVTRPARERYLPYRLPPR